MSQTRLVALLLLSLAAPAANAAGATPRYTNAELVSVNPQNRLVVIRNTDGREQTLQLDDNVAGLEALRAGDRVILTLREEPGLTRISSIAKSLAPQAAPNPPASRPPVAAVAPLSSGLSRFNEQVAALAQQAGQVDAVWNEFRTACNVTLRSTYTDGRDWFSLWDDTAQIDVSGGICRDLFNQLVGQGETVKAGMAGAEEAARKADLPPGDLRETRRRYSMEWGGWGLPAPELLKP